MARLELTVHRHGKRYTCWSRRRDILRVYPLLILSIMSLTWKDWPRLSLWDNWWSSKCLQRNTTRRIRCLKTNSQGKKVVKTQLGNHLPWEIWKLTVGYVQHRPWRKTQGSFSSAVLVPRRRPRVLAKLIPPFCARAPRHVGTVISLSTDLWQTCSRTNWIRLWRIDRVSRSQSTHS